MIRMKEFLKPEHKVSGVMDDDPSNKGVMSDEPSDKYPSKMESKEPDSPEEILPHNVTAPTKRTTLDIIRKGFGRGLQNYGNSAVQEGFDDDKFYYDLHKATVDQNMDDLEKRMPTIKDAHRAKWPKEPGDVWRTATGKYGAMNRSGEVKYFDDNRMAGGFSRNPGSGETGNYDWDTPDFEEWLARQPGSPTYQSSEEDDSYEYPYSHEEPEMDDETPQYRDMDPDDPMTYAEYPDDKFHKHEGVDRTPEQEAQRQKNLDKEEQRKQKDRDKWAKRTKRWDDYKKSKTESISLAELSPEIYAAVRNKRRDQAEKAIDRELNLHKTGKSLVATKPQAKNVNRLLRKTHAAQDALDRKTAELYGDEEARMNPYIGELSSSTYDRAAQHRIDRLPPDKPWKSDPATKKKVDRAMELRSRKDEISTSLKDYLPEWKEHGSLWKSNSGKFGAKNKRGKVKYFRKKNDAYKFSMSGSTPSNESNISMKEDMTDPNWHKNHPQGYIKKMPDGRLQATNRNGTIKYFRSFTAADNYTDSIDPQWDEPTPTKPTIPTPAPLTPDQERERRDREDADAYDTWRDDQLMGMDESDCENCNRRYPTTYNLKCPSCGRTPPKYNPPSDPNDPNDVKKIKRAPSPLDQVTKFKEVAPVDGDDHDPWGMGYDESYMPLLHDLINERNYRKEYDNYQSRPEQKKRRAQRNKTRRKFERAGKVKKGDGKDIHHRDGNPFNQHSHNTVPMNKSKNRSLKERGPIVPGDTMKPFDKSVIANMSPENKARLLLRIKLILLLKKKQREMDGQVMKELSGETHGSYREKRAKQNPNWSKDSKLRSKMGRSLDLSIGKSDKNDPDPKSPEFQRRDRRLGED